MQLTAERGERFAAGLTPLWPEGGRLGVAVSGGPDSLALLLLAARALPGRVAAATVDHGLRTESAAEAAFVGAVCAEIGVPHHSLPVHVAEGNVQSQARAARYSALGQWCADQGLSALATAHHADDQAETLLLRLNRASGVSGLAGVRARGRVPGSLLPLSLPLLRPLLAWRRAELEAVVAEARIEPVRDPSNADVRFDRVRLRQALATADWLNVEAIAASAGHLADADLALDWAAAREWADCVEAGGMGAVYRPSAPRAIALRVMARVLRDLGVEDLRGGAVAGLFDTLVAGKTASIGALVVRPSRDGWHFMPAPRRRDI